MHSWFVENREFVVVSVGCSVGVRVLGGGGEWYFGRVLVENGRVGCCFWIGGWRLIGWAIVRGVDWLLFEGVEVVVVVGSVAIERVVDLTTMIKSDEK